MIAKRRQYYSTAVYYVSARCPKEGRILLKEEAKGLFMECIKKFKERFGFGLFAYSILDDSIDMILRTDERNNISKVMQAILLSFSRKYQYRFGYKGRVWQGRFESILLHKDYEVMRYIRFVHHKPVMTSASYSSERYKWSSAMFYMNSNTSYCNGLGNMVDRYIYNE